MPENTAPPNAWRDLSTDDYRAIRGQRQLSLEIPISMHAELIRIAAKSDLKVSQVVRRAIKRHVALELAESGR